MANPTLASDGGLSDITSLLELVQGKTTTSSTKSNATAADTTAQINEILSGNQGLAAVTGAQKAAGLYNSSTNTQLTNDLLTRTAAAVSARNAGTTTTTKSGGLNKSTVANLVATTALKKALGGKGIVQNSKDLYSKLKDELGLGDNPVATEGASISGEGIAPTALDSSAVSQDILGTLPGDVTASAADSAVAGTDATSQAISQANAAVDAGGGTDAAIDSAAIGAGVDANFVSGVDAAGAALDASAADAGIGAATGDALAGETAGELGASDLGAAAAGGWTALAVYGAMDLNQDIQQGSSDVLWADALGGLGTGDIVQGIKSGNLSDTLGPAGGILNDITGGAIDSVGKATGWIVCTELLRQGKFNRKHYVAGLAVFNSYPKELLVGYYVWARPLVSHLRTNPNSLLSRCTRYVFATRAEYLAARAGVSGARDLLQGQVISAVLYGFCFALGHLINWSARYGTRLRSVT
jgi:hypothetical protein